MTLQLKHLLSYIVLSVTTLFLYTIAPKNIELKEKYIDITSDQYENLYNKIFNSLKNAQINIWIESFNISNKKIISLLAEIKKKGIIVDCFHGGKISPKYLIHKKTIVIDDKICMLPSLNLSSYKSISSQLNNIVEIRDKEVAFFLKDKSKTHFKKKILNKYILKIWKTSKINKCYKRIIKDINQSKKSIILSMFRLSDRKICKTLIRKHKEGVNIFIALDRGETGDEVKLMLQSGINIIKSKHKINHHKIAIIDDKIFWGGSANWTNNGLHNNDEVVIRIKSKESNLSFLKKAKKIICDNILLLQKENK